MTYRLDLERGALETVLFFTGQLDAAALVELRTRLETTSAARVVLRAGTAVTANCIDAVRGLPVPVHAESHFLAQWLAKGSP